MKIKIRNTKDQKSYDVDVNDTNKSRYLRRPKLTDEEVCDKCGKAISECVCEKEVSDEKEEKIELTEEELEQIKKLIKLLPDLEKILEKTSEEKSEESEESEESEKEEMEKEDSQKEEIPEEESKEESSEIILEASEDNIIETPEEENFEEEDVLEDEGGMGVHDSILNPGVIEKSKVSDSIEDTVSHEQEVANTWGERYEKMLRS